MSVTSLPDMAKASFADAVMAQLMELHGLVVAEHKRALQSAGLVTKEPAAHSPQKEAAAEGVDVRQLDSTTMTSTSQVHSQPSELKPFRMDRTASAFRHEGLLLPNSDRASDTGEGEDAVVRRNSRRSRFCSDDGGSMDAPPPRAISQLSVTGGGHRSRRTSRVSANQEFAMHDFWRGENLYDNQYVRRSSTIGKEFSPSLREAVYGEGQSTDTLLRRTESRLSEVEHSSCEKYMVHPNSRKRLAWDVIGLILICHDIIFLPLQVFEMPTTPFVVAMGWICLCFWSMDLPSSFFVGFHTLGGSLIMDPRKVAKRYLLTWFPLDIFLVTIDWMIQVLEHADSSEAGNDYENFGLARLGKTVRIMRLLRMLRLMRLAKLPKYFVQIEEHIQSELVIVLLGIAKLTLCILVINHLIACAWFAIGSIDDGMPSWVRRYNFDGAAVSYQYTSSLHWSLTQFTPASMEVFPQNARERSFALVVLVFALITFSSFVSSITNAMTHLRNMNSEYAKQFVQLSRYMRFHKISTPMAVRVRRHLARTIVKKQERLEESEVTLLKMLSEPLLMDLRLEVFRPLLDHHPFFQKYTETNFVAVRKLCHKAILEFSLAPGDLLFSSGETCDRMFFIKNGTLRYSHETARDTLVGPQGCFQDGQTDDSPVRANEWICEACLWTPWRHMGHMHAFAGSGLVAVEAEKFREVAQKTRSAAMNPARYAELFVQHLNSLGIRELTDLHSISFDYETAVAAACSAPSVSEASMSLASMRSTDMDHNNASNCVDSPLGDNGKDVETKEKLGTLASL